MPTKLEQPLVRVVTVPAPPRTPEPPAPAALAPEPRRRGMPLLLTGALVAAAGARPALGVGPLRGGDAAAGVRPFSPPTPVRPPPAVRGQEIAELTAAPNVPHPITRT